MTQDPPLRVLRLQLTYLAIVALVVLLQTLPLQSLPYPFAPADVPLAITFAWIMRRPDVMSPILITLAFLFADAILQRPPGLWDIDRALRLHFLAHADPWSEGNSISL